MLSLSSGNIDLYICLLGSDNENNMKMNEDIEFMPYIAAFRFILSQTFLILISNLFQIKKLHVMIVDFMMNLLTSFLCYQTLYFFNIHSQS